MADLPRSVGPYPVVRRLGSGGQGTVYLVRSPKRQAEIDESLEIVNRALTRGSSVGKTPDERLANARSLVEAVVTHSRQDTSDELGAGKVYAIPSGLLADKAMARLEAEFEVLKSLSSPNILRLFHTDLSSRLMVSEYHPNLTLADHPTKFRGRALEALRAFHGLVKAVADLHARKVVHRDIKPVNIFVGVDHRLVLGDFGIVFVEDGRGDRLTDTFERVGSRDWMAPWAQTGLRIDDVTPTFDVFPLGKVLWSMLSGRRMLPFWYWDHAAHDLTQIFPNVSDMRTVNELILRHTVVQQEKDCLDSAMALLLKVEEAIATIEGGGQMMGNDAMRCRACGRGVYQAWFQNNYRTLLVPSATNERVQNAFEELFNTGQFMTVRVFRCEQCGHLALFQFPDRQALPAWQGVKVP